MVTPRGEIFSTYWKTPKRLSENDRCNGYLSVTTVQDKKVTARYVHRMVAETFLENPDGLTDVNHIDHDKTNNSLSNLEWVSHTENMKEARLHYGVDNLNKIVQKH